MESQTSVRRNVTNGEEQGETRHAADCCIRRPDLLNVILFMSNAQNRVDGAMMYLLAG